VDSPVIIPVSGHDPNLDEFDSEEIRPARMTPLMVVVDPEPPRPTEGLPAPFSRVEAAKMRRHRTSSLRIRRWSARQSRAVRQNIAATLRQSFAGVTGYSLALCVLISLRVDSCVAASARVMSRMSVTIRRTTLNLVRRARASASAAGRAGSIAHGTIARQILAATVLARRGFAIVRRHAMEARRGYQGRTDAPAVEENVIRHLESDGALVATALGAVAIAYGGLLVVSWRDSAPPAHARAVAVQQPARVDRADVPQSLALGGIEAQPRNRALEARPRARVISASAINTIWRRNDTRSLQQAFERLRRETLAFHRCGVRITAADRAVARCDGVTGGVTDGADAAAPARWTIDFQRTGDRWAIQRVSNR